MEKIYNKKKIIQGESKKLIWSSRSKIPDIKDFCDLKYWKLFSMVMIDNSDDGLSFKAVTTLPEEGMCTSFIYEGQHYHHNNNTFKCFVEHESFV